MKTEEDVLSEILKIENDYRHVLKGSVATVEINAPRALQQTAAESHLNALYWVLGKKFESKLKGFNT